MRLVIDTREHKLHDALSGVPFDIAPLHIGDACIKSSEDVDLLVIERKTIDDLAASIKDGRLKEQLIRLQASGTMVAYVIEGHRSWRDEGFVGGLPSKSVNSTLHKLQFKYRIPCYSTTNVGGTAALLEGLLQRFKDDKHLEWGVLPAPPTIESYNASVVKTVKKENLTPQLCFIQQLCCIPGISSTKANMIITTRDCTNLTLFLQKLDQLETVPGIGRKLAETIKTYLS
jgi:ERCC4-type nuclease